MVVDASVLAKLFSAENLSDEARRVVAEAVEIWVPAHALAEVAEILSRKVALGEVTDEQCMLALGAAVRLVRSAPLDDLVAPAVAIARETGISVYDALYVALATARGEELITWDKRLLRHVKGTRFEQMARPLQSPWET